jgi:hypothetical protein
VDTLHVYRVNYDWLTALPGSRDAHVRETVKAFLTQFSDEDERDPDDDPPEPTVAEALEEILAGKVPDETFGGDAYHNAMSAIYWTCAKRLDILNFSRAAVYFKFVDDALRSAGSPAPLGLNDLAFRGAPFHLPFGDATSLGYLDPVEVREGFAIYDRLSLLGLPQDVRETVEHLGVWLKAAASIDSLSTPPSCSFARTCRRRRGCPTRTRGGTIAAAAPTSRG